MSILAQPEKPTRSYASPVRFPGWAFGRPYELGDGERPSTALAAKPQSATDHGDASDHEHPDGGFRRTGNAGYRRDRRSSNSVVSKASKGRVSCVGKAIIGLTIVYGLKSDEVIPIGVRHCRRIGKGGVLPRTVNDCTSIHKVARGRNRNT